METKVLKEQDPASRQCGRLPLGLLADAVADKKDSLREKQAKAHSDGPEGQLGSGPPLGLPRCEARITRAPALIACWIVGRDARTRVSSTIWPPAFMGTLKSTRMKTRFPSGPGHGWKACSWMVCAWSAVPPPSI